VNGEEAENSLRRIMTSKNIRVVVADK
jgi:hypothetical protein